MYVIMFFINFLFLFSGQQYNIPITIWLRTKHPQQGPLVYVTPTTGMGINQSQYVDSNGLVYLPYISEWKQVRKMARWVVRGRGEG